MTAAELIEFERDVAAAFEAGKILGPIHLSGGNEEQLIEIFKEIPRDAWIFSTWRSHLHALLHGIPPELVMSEILAGRSMMLHFPEYHFFTSAIVGGICSISCGVAAGLKTEGSKRRAWCFVGDMAASGGAFHEAVQYASGHALPITFVVEDNGLATNTPTVEAWGPGVGLTPGIVPVRRYTYERQWPHVGSGVYVAF